MYILIYGERYHIQTISKHCTFLHRAQIDGMPFLVGFKVNIPRGVQAGRVSPECTGVCKNKTKLSVGLEHLN